MNINEYIENMLRHDDAEKPLDNIVEGGGLTKVFRTIGCIGDSLSSGEFEACDENGENRTYHDMYEYSWGQYIARETGVTVRNFSRGGLTAKTYMTDHAVTRGLFDPALACQAYIIALGVNDLIGKNLTVGDMSDICDEDPEKNADTFCGWYARVIEKYKSIQPDAKFFLMTMPKGLVEADNELRRQHREVLFKMAEKYTNAYVLDLYTYMPPYVGDFKDKYYLANHMNPFGYMLTAKAVMSYIDYIIRHNYEDFIQVPFIGIGTHNKK